MRQSLFLMLFLLSQFHSVATGQLVQGNPPRHDLNISYSQQLVDDLQFQAVSATATFRNYSIYTLAGFGPRRFFDLLDAEYTASTEHYGVGVRMELESYRAGNIRWELCLGYERANFREIESNYEDPKVQMNMLVYSISPVWDIQRGKSNQFTRVGLGLTAITPRTYRTYTRLSTGSRHVGNLRQHDIFAVTANTNTTLPWINFSNLSLDLELGAMWTHDQVETLIRAGLNYGFKF